VRFSLFLKREPSRQGFCCGAEKERRYAASRTGPKMYVLDRQGKLSMSVDRGAAVGSAGGGMFGSVATADGDK
jgi:hypothetical protein